MTRLMARTPLGEIDRKIVAALMLNGRATWKVIAPWVGASEATVHRRYRTLRTSGVIRVVGSYDVNRTGCGLSVFIRLSCKPGTTARVMEAFAALDEVRMVSMVSGTADLIVEIVVDEQDTLASFLLHRLPHTNLLVKTESLAVIRVFTMAPRWNSRILPDAAVKQLRDPLVNDWERPNWPEPPREHPLNDTERAVLTELRDDGRLSYQEIAQRIRKSETTVRRVVLGLIAQSTLQFRTLVEPFFLGYDLEFMLWVQIDPGHLEEVGRKLGAHHATKYLAVTSGRFNLITQAVLPRATDLYDYMTRVIGGLPGVQHADITLQLATIKRGWHRVDTYRAQRSST